MLKVSLQNIAFNLFLTSGLPLVYTGKLALSVIRVSDEDYIVRYCPDI